METSEHETPLVIRSLKSHSANFLSGFLRDNSAEILADISRHGAVLLRGFDLQSLRDFEEQLTSIVGMYPTREVAFAELGRTRVAGARFVFTTNSYFKTGGSLHFGAFHTENYFTPDVPHYIAFFCEQPSRIGGETGLVNTAKLYSDLPEATKEKLLAHTFLVHLFPIAEFTNRYRMDERSTISFCHDQGLRLVTVDDTQYVAIYKPTVLEHPRTRERALQLSFGYIKGLGTAVSHAFKDDYKRWQWMLHRLIWYQPVLHSLHDRVIFRNVRKLQKEAGLIYVTNATAPVPGARSIAALFSEDEVHALAASARRRYSCFTWQRGDLLIVDNLKVAHNGMAGWGPRRLRVMLCNSFPLVSSHSDCGLHRPSIPIQDRGNLGSELIGADYSAKTLSASVASRS